MPDAFHCTKYKILVVHITHLQTPQKSTISNSHTNVTNIIIEGNNILKPQPSLPLKCCKTYKEKRSVNNHSLAFVCNKLQNSFEALKLGSFISLNNITHSIPQLLIKCGSTSNISFCPTQPYA